jgi:hypothetical protein
MRTETGGTTTMNSLRIGLSGAAKACALTLFAATAACSSSSSSASPPASGGGGDGGALSAPGPVVDGTGTACASMAQTTYATKIALNVTWPGTQAVVQGKSGIVNIWLLSIYNVDSSNKITGTTKTCGNSTPPITLTDTADELTGEPSGSQVQNAFPAASWDAVPTNNITGTLGGLKIGASITIDPTVTLYGVAASSTLTDATTKWPANGSDIDVTALTTAGGDPYVAGTNLPGVTAFPNGAAPFILPKTSLDMTAPAASQLQVVLRTALSLYGTSSSCTDESGTAFVTQLNNHVVGCSLANDAGACNSDQYEFIDSNTTQYVPAAGTFVAKMLTTGATCADVLSTLP